MSSVLVDTSVWRDYFAGRPRARELGVLLEEDGVVLTHPAVIGELVLGGLAATEQSLLGRLPTAMEVSSPELLAFIRSRRLARRGIGWVDSQLLASALVASAKLWSLDRKLSEAATDLRAAFVP